MLTEIVYFSILWKVTHLTTTVFLYQKDHPDDGRITGQNMLEKIL